MDEKTTTQFDGQIAQQEAIINGGKAAGLIVPSKLASPARLRFFRRSRAATLRGLEDAARKANRKAKREEWALNHSNPLPRAPANWKPDAKALAMLRKSFAQAMVAAMSFRAKAKKVKR